MKHPDNAGVFFIIVGCLAAVKFVNKYLRKKFASNLLHSNNLAEKSQEILMIVEVAGSFLLTLLISFKLSSFCSDSLVFFGLFPILLFVSIITIILSEGVIYASTKLNDIE
jgi:hypothetical protein